MVLRTVVEVYTEDTGIMNFHNAARRRSKYHRLIDAFHAVTISVYITR